MLLADGDADADGSGDPAVTAAAPLPVMLVPAADAPGAVIVI